MFRDPEDKALYVIASGGHGWEPGRMHVFRAKGRAPGVEGAVWDSLEGNPTLHPRSFFSQPTAVLTLLDPERSNKPYLVYVGDNWVFGTAHDPAVAVTEMDLPPAGRHTEKYKAYIGKLLTWEHTRLPFASYVMLPMFFDTASAGDGGKGRREGTARVREKHDASAPAEDNHTNIESASRDNHAWSVKCAPVPV